MWMFFSFQCASQYTITIEFLFNVSFWVVLTVFCLKFVLGNCTFNYDYKKIPSWETRKREFVREFVFDVSLGLF